MRSGCSLSAGEGDVGYFPHSRSFPPFPLAKGTGSGYNGSTFPGKHAGGHAMKKTVSYSKSQLLDDLGRLALMVLASVIMAVNLKSFVQAGDLVPGPVRPLLRHQLPAQRGARRHQLQTHRQAVHPVLLRGHPVHQPAHRSDPPYAHYRRCAAHLHLRRPHQRLCHQPVPPGESHQRRHRFHLHRPLPAVRCGCLELWAMW